MNNQHEVSESNTSNPIEAAAALIIKREESRRKKLEHDRKLRKKEEHEERIETFRNIRQSLTIIKWCVMGISTVILLCFLAGIFVLVQVKSKVNEIEQQIARVQEIIRHPMQNLGSALGSKLDSRFESILMPKENADSNE